MSSTVGRRVTLLGKFQVAFTAQLYLTVSGVGHFVFSSTTGPNFGTSKVMGVKDILARRCP